MRRRTRFWKRNICPSTIGGFGVPRPSPRTITERAAELEAAFHLESGRVIGTDWVVRHDNRYFQVQAQARQYSPAKGKVTVYAREPGRLQICYRGRAVAWEEIPGPVPAEAVRTREAKAKQQKPPTPKADHPWRRDYRKMPWSVGWKFVFRRGVRRGSHGDRCAGRWSGDRGRG